jgi:hypothetical protein
MEDGKDLSYHEKLSQDGFRFDKYFRCVSLKAVPDQEHIRGLQKIVIILASLVPQFKPPVISDAEFDEFYYAIYVKSR